MIVSMKMLADRMEGANAINRHGPDGVAVGGVEWTESVLVPWQGEVRRWGPAAFETLAEADFAAIAALRPELVVFGSGPRLRFPKPACSGR
jgi:uncharacterized protein